MTAYVSTSQGNSVRSVLPSLGGFQMSSSDHQGLLDKHLYLLSCACPAPLPNAEGPSKASVCHAFLCILQVESLRHSMGPGSYGDNIGGGQIYSPREIRVSEPCCLLLVALTRMGL